MRKKGLYLSIILISAILFISFSSASISIAGISDLYNLGDKLSLNLEIFPKDVAGKFEINLLCNEKRINLERMSAEPRFKEGTQVSYSTSLKLIPSYIEDLKGKCRILASLANEEVTSQFFYISNKILITAGLDQRSYSPGSEPTITINAKKENGEELEGFIKTSGFLTIEKQIKQGEFIEKFKISEDTPAENYKIDISVYDLFEGEKLNEETSSIYFIVNPVPRSIKIGLSSHELDPETNLTILAELLDQSGKLINFSIPLTILSPDKKETYKTIQSGKSENLLIPAGAQAGTWIVESEISGIKESAEFVIRKVGKVNYTFENNLLIITNIGNDKYSGTINLSLGNTPLNLDILDLLPGKEKRFYLEAPNGDYILSVGNGDETIENKVFLTGDAIKIIESGKSLIKSNIFVWIFILVILFLFSGVLLMRIKKTPFKLLGYPKEQSNSLQAKKIIKIDENISFKTKGKVTQAENSLVLKGEKQPSCSVSLKISNFNRLSENTKKEIIKYISSVENKQGVVEKSGEYFIIIFNPLLTKSFSNESNTAEFSFELYKELSNLNKKVSDKFDFGIGIHIGDLIASIQEGKLKYTSIGNTILLSKKMSDLCQGKIYSSEDFRKKLLKELRVEKVSQIGSTQIYSILHVSSREANVAKLEDLLKRIHE